MTTVSHADELVYESFGDAAYEGQTLVGYSGTSAELGAQWHLVGLSRRWAGVFEGPFGFEPVVC